MNVFYFNITYTCNSNCVFCYSHNTIHSGRIHNEIELDDFVNFLKSQNVQSTDRVIINGGEPFMHSNIIHILKSLLYFKCEVLIYTNGRCLENYDFSFMTSNYRFVIPVHGFRELHDMITQSPGSYDEMVRGINHLTQYSCKIDIKVIINPDMISSMLIFNQTLSSLDDLRFNNAVHITKMADTIISKKNGLPSIDNREASFYTKQLFEHMKKREVIIKLFDTCVKEIKIESCEDRVIPLNVLFKDSKSSRNIALDEPNWSCRKRCPKSRFCHSAVYNYTVLEYNKIFYNSIE